MFEFSFHTINQIRQVTPAKEDNIFVHGLPISPTSVSWSDTLMFLHMFDFQKQWDYSDKGSFLDIKYKKMSFAAHRKLW